jgi:hypothetical protein
LLEDQAFDDFLLIFLTDTLPTHQLMFISHWLSPVMARALTILITDHQAIAFIINRQLPPSPFLQPTLSNQLLPLPRIDRHSIIQMIFSQYSLNLFSINWITMVVVVREKGRVFVTFGTLVIGSN